jgi:pyrroloquinoline-quinone synthase
VLLADRVVRSDDSQEAPGKLAAVLSWIEAGGYEYFRKRLSEARRDVEHGLQVTLDYFQTREAQQRALEILQFKLDVLWSMLDTMQHTYGIG